MLITVNNGDEFKVFKPLLITSLARPHFTKRWQKSGDNVSEYSTWRRDVHTAGVPVQFGSKLWYSIMVACTLGVQWCSRFSGSSPVSILTTTPTDPHQFLAIRIYPASVNSMAMSGRRPTSHGLIPVSGTGRMSGLLPGWSKFVSGPFTR